MKLFKKLPALLLMLLLAFLFVCSFFVKTPKPDISKLSTVIYDENGKILSVFLNKNQQWNLPVDVSKSYKLKTCVLNYEDKYFYNHFGINPISLLKAFWINLKTGKKKLGASTITMQTATLLKPKTRTYFNKFIEAFQAVKLEIFYTKKQILDMYFQNAPYGKNYVGVYTACYKYFGCTPQKLSWAQAAALAVLPQNPNLPLKNIKKFTSKRDKLLKSLLNSKVLTQQQFKTAINEKFNPKSNKLFKKNAIHLSYMLKNTSPLKKINTTINFKLQNNVNYICKNYGNVLKNENINNLCALVANTKTGEIKSWVGSQNFYKSQVDGVIANRSTGSLLKPFLYALAFDLQLITPTSLLNDVPTNWGSFSPVNANQKYMGLVPANTALVKSLNIPAAQLLQKVGINMFYTVLKKCGLKSLFRTAKEYGLSLVIGGAESNMLQLASLFKGLASNGNFESLTYLKNQGTIKNKVLSDGACYLTLDILKDLKRPGSQYYWQQFDDKTNIAWKTGTSYGNRDAWAIGVTPEWVVATWVGNFDGSCSAKIIGAKTAAPLMFKIFNYLPKKNKWFKKSKNLKPVYVCALSGYKPTENCKQKKLVLMPNNANNLPFCPYHKSYIVNNNASLSLCSKCWKGFKKQKKVYTVYPPNVVKHLAKNGVTIINPPKHNPKCTACHSSKSVSIVYPTNNLIIMLPKGVNFKRQKLTLKAASINKNTNIYWFIDGEFVKKTSKIHELVMVISQGKHKLYICDDDSNCDESTFTIKYP